MPEPRRLGRGGGGSQLSPGSPATALPRAGQAGHLPVHERRPVARRHVRPQAGPATVRGPGSARRDHDRAPQERQGHALAVLGPAARPERNRGDRPLPAHRRLHRRDLRDPLDVHRQPEPRAVALDDELGQHAADPAQPGFVADLRPGYGEPEPAGLRGPLSRQAGRRPSIVEQQLPAWHLSRDAHPQSIDRPGPDHPRRHEPPPLNARAACAARPAPVAQPRAPQRHAAGRRARGANRVAGDGVPHAVRGARGV